MANTQYQIYLNSVLSLCKSLTVKHAIVADAINQDLESNASGLYTKLYQVNLADPTTWKYYLNLSGVYHETDTPMSVISQDTLQTISFTKENLVEHVATAAAYEPGSSYYLDLVNRYPNQELLIRGILHSIDMTTAINAADGSILWFDPTAVESNEMALISDLEGQIQLYTRRWLNQGYANVDDLYLAGHLVTLYSLLPAFVLGIRLKYCHTYQAHSFHIKSYLAGQGGLDDAVDYMTKAQQLWLYRNIRYLRLNAGKQETFNALVSHMLTERGLPLSRWTFKQDTSTIVDTLQPTASFTRGAVNALIPQTGDEVRTTDGMLLSEVGAARNNSDQGYWKDTKTTLALALSSQLTTKVLESSVWDTTDASPYTLASALVNHWLYFAAQGQYLSAITADNPSTGESYTFNAADAFVIYVYCYNASHGIVLDTVPLLYASYVRKPVTPTIDELLSLADADTVERQDAVDFFTNLPPLARSYLSIESFLDKVTAIHDSQVWMHSLYSTQGHMWKRAYLDAMMQDFYQDAVCDFGAGTSFAQWFKDRELDIPTMSASDMGTVAASILKQATGQGLASTTRLADLQAAMLSVMTRLSSYSIQFLASINNTPIIVFDTPSIRMGDYAVEGATEDEVEIPLAEPMDLDGSGATYVTDLVDPSVSLTDWGGSAVGNYANPVYAKVSKRFDTASAIRARMPLFSVLAFSDNQSLNPPTPPVTTLPDYSLIGYQSLPEAFASLVLVPYPAVTQADQTAIQTAYEAFIQANGQPG